MRDNQRASDAENTGKEQATDSENKNNQRASDAENINKEQATDNENKNNQRASDAENFNKEQATDSENYVYELDGKMYINLTNKCCNACEFCIRNNADGIKGSKLILQHDAEYNGVIEQIERANFGYSEAVFCGYGEPTYMNECMIRVAQYLHKKGKTTRLNTNGLGNLINKKDITRELVGKIDKVSVSLNEANAKDYAAICHPCFGEKAYEEIQSFAKKCVDLGLCTTLTIVSNGDKTREEKCRKIANDIGAKFKAREYISNNENYT